MFSSKTTVINFIYNQINLYSDHLWAELGKTGKSSTSSMMAAVMVPVPSSWHYNNSWLLAYQCVQGRTLIKPVEFDADWRMWVTAILCFMEKWNPPCCQSHAFGENSVFNTLSQQLLKAFLFKSEMVLPNQLEDAPQSVNDDISCSH